MPPPPVDLAQLLRSEQVVILPGTPTKALVITALADHIVTDLSPHDRLAFIQAVLEREDVTPTALGNGIAIPHSRTPALAACRIAIGVMPVGIPWGAPDGRPVHLALLMASRESDHAEHLRVMATLAQRLRRPGLAQRIAALTEHAAIVREIVGG